DNHLRNLPRLQREVGTHIGRYLDQYVRPLAALEALRLHMDLVSSRLQFGCEVSAGIVGGQGARSPALGISDHHRRVWHCCTTLVTHGTQNAPCRGLRQSRKRKEENHSKSREL